MIHDYKKKMKQLKKKNRQKKGKKSIREMSAEMKM